ncbi:hypothetical protein F4803DRAFT_245434 [Xylaria telfairii]|nr:hypothetical protein F4803DRAFT_245434 [Xylaria telfairii]
MTDQVSGSSLPQTRHLGQQQQEHDHDQVHDQHHDQHRQHTHPHFRNVQSSHHNHNHNHNRNHQHLHHVRSQRSSSRPHQRDISVDNVGNAPDIVVIVETISVLQVTDSTGATIIRTLPHDYPTAPVTADGLSESTVASSTKPPSPTETDLPHTTSTSSASHDGNGVAHPSSSSSSTVEDPTATLSGSSMPTSFPTLSYVPITATPLSTAPVFPSLGGLSNSSFSSSSSAFSNSSAIHSFTTASEGNFSALGIAPGTGSKTSSHPSSSVFTQSPFGTSTSKTSSSISHTYLTSTVKPEVTTASGGDGIGSPADTANGSGPVSTSDADSGSGSDSGSASAATIAGSVVGAISGFAIILLLAAAILRWKKRKSSMKLIQESGNDRGYGAMTTGGSGGPAGGGGGGMSEQRRPIPFAIPAALANLTSQSRFSRSTVSSDGAERGFTKVSGRKLPPVLQFGGDGYTDPRATMMSDQSIDYRASQHFFGEAPLSRLAVGAPMLQETSAPVFHASPARTAVATAGPFSDPFSDDNRVESPTLPPTLPPDPVGRSHLPRDRSTRSHGSFSRFTEDL